MGNACSCDSADVSDDPRQRRQDSQQDGVASPGDGSSRVKYEQDHVQQQETQPRSTTTGEGQSGPSVPPELSSLSEPEVQLYCPPPPPPSSSPPPPDIAAANSTSATDSPSDNSDNPKRSVESPLGGNDDDDDLFSECSNRSQGGIVFKSCESTDSGGSPSSTRLSQSIERDYDGSPSSSVSDDLSSDTASSDESSEQPPCKRSRKRVWQQQKDDAFDDAEEETPPHVPSFPAPESSEPPKGKFESLFDDQPMFFGADE